MLRLSIPAARGRAAPASGGEGPSSAVPASRTEQIPECTRLDSALHRHRGVATTGPRRAEAGEDRAVAAQITRPVAWRLLGASKA